MRKISKIKLKYFHEMGEMEMRNIIGGSGGTGGSGGDDGGSGTPGGVGLLMIVYLSVVVMNYTGLMGLIVIMIV